MITIDRAIFGNTILALSQKYQTRLFELADGHTRFCAFVRVQGPDAF